MERSPPTEKMPVIDFTKSMVVGIFLGSKPSAGYEVEIVAVRAQEKDLVIEYAEAAWPRHAGGADPYRTVPPCLGPPACRHGAVYPVPDTGSLQPVAGSNARYQLLANGYQLGIRSRLIAFSLTGFIIPLLCSNLYWGVVMPGTFGDRSVMVATSSGWSGVRTR